MSAVKISKAAQLKLRFHRTGDDAFEALSALLIESSQHRVSGLADRYDKDSAKRIQVVEVIANSHNTALAGHMPGKSLADTGFAHCLIENLAGDSLH